jgi:phosphatidylglycerophosphate synthase
VAIAAEQPTFAACEQQRARNYPLSRWYLRPLAQSLAAYLAQTGVRPWQISLLGVSFAAVAVGLLIADHGWAPWCAALALANWFCDRLDGLVARAQGAASAAGAWLDANLDELVDLSMQAGVAAAAAVQGFSLAWPLWGAFVFGKYLLMYGMQREESLAAVTATSEALSPQANPRGGVLKRLYHLPGNADIRIHLLVAALATGWLVPQLAIVAAYYNLRWMARYGLVCRRLAGGAR